MKYLILRDRHTDKRYRIIYDSEIGECIPYLGTKYEAVGCGLLELEKIASVSGSQGELGDLLDIMTIDHFADAEPNEVN